MEAVKISNLSYKYPSADEYCLKNVSFLFRRERYVRLSARTAAAKQQFAISSAALFRLFTAESLKGRLKYSEKHKRDQRRRKGQKNRLRFPKPLYSKQRNKRNCF